MTLPVPPSANRWWRSVGNRVLLSQEAREYKSAVATRMLVARVTMIRPPAKVKVSVVWYRGRRAGDLDKRLGVLFDAIQGTAYENDAQITEIHARREEDREHPRIELEVSAL